MVRQVLQGRGEGHRVQPRARRRRATSPGGVLAIPRRPPGPELTFSWAVPLQSRKRVAIARTAPIGPAPSRSVRHEDPRRPRRLDRHRPGRPPSTSTGSSPGSPSRAPRRPTPAPTSLSVADVDPAPGSTLLRAPAGLTVTFDRAIFPPSLGADFRLDRVAADGSEATVARARGSANPGRRTRSEVVVTPPSTLGPGHYRLYLLGGSGLIGDDGSTVVGGDRVVDDFTVAGPSTGPVAVDLGSPVGAVASAIGRLDPVGNPGASMITGELPPGHLLEARRRGRRRPDRQPAPPRALDRGRPGSRRRGHGREPSRLPGRSLHVRGPRPGRLHHRRLGADDLPAGTARAGSFRVQVVADPADAPTAVRSFGLDHADPTRPDTTGFTLQFAGPLNGAAMVGHAWDLVQVVDDSGRVWSAFATNYTRRSPLSRSSSTSRCPRGITASSWWGRGIWSTSRGRPPSCRASRPAPSPSSRRRRTRRRTPRTTSAPSTGTSSTAPLGRPPSQTGRGGHLPPGHHGSVHLRPRDDLHRLRPLDHGPRRRQVSLARRRHPGPPPVTRLLLQPGVVTLTVKGGPRVDDRLVVPGGERARRPPPRQRRRPGVPPRPASRRPGPARPPRGHRRRRRPLGIAVDLGRRRGAVGGDRHGGRANAATPPAPRRSPPTRPRRTSPRAQGWSATVIGG